MKKIVFVFLMITSTGYVNAQSAMITLKKGHKTIERYFPGDYINCQLQSSEWINARIYRIYNDSLQVRPFQLVQYMNSLGIPSVDTLWNYDRKLALNNITAFPRRDHSFAYVKNGTLLQILGGGYILLNVINTLADGDQLFADNNGVNLAIAAAVFVAGTIIHASYSSELKVGHKYKLQYVALAPAQ